MNEIDSTLVEKIAKKNLANILHKLNAGKTLSAREVKLIDQSQSDATLAKQYQCEERTIHNYRKQGAPLDDPVAMQTWWAGRKNIPPGVRAAAGRSTPKAPKKKKVSTTELKRGAASALRRLEESEAEAFESLQRAIESDNDLDIKSVHERWLKTATALARFDILVESNRRDSGELYPRSEIERILRALAWYLRMAGQQASAVAAPELCKVTDPAMANKLLYRLMWEQLMNGVSALASHSAGEIAVPGWAVQALAHDLEFVLRDVPDVVKRRAKAIGSLVKTNAKNTVNRKDL